MQKFLIILSLLIEVTHGQEAELPDIARSFKNAKLISTTEIDPFNKVLSFGSNETYEALKAQLHPTLGAGWSESKEKEPTRPKPEITGLKNPPPTKVISEGNTVLISGDYPDTKVRLTVFKDSIFKTKYFILLAIERKKSQKKGS